MPSPLERRRNNVRTGIFVSVTLILAVVIIVVLSDVWRWLTLDTWGYTVEYPVDAGVSNLKKGADVRVGGMAMGQVEAVRAVLSADAPFERIAVDFTLDCRVRLYSNAKILVTTPLIGADAWLDIPDVGRLTDEEGLEIEDARLLEEDGRIDGTVAVGLLSTLVGPDNAEDVTTFSNFLAAIPDKYEEHVAPILVKADTTLKEAGDIAGKINKDYDRWRLTVNDVMDRANSIAENIEKTTAETQAMVEENRPDIDVFIDNMTAFSGDAREISGRVRAETVDKITELLERGKEGVASFTSAIEDLQVKLDAEWPNIDEALANARLASQQLKLTMVEVRRSPWKFLYRPSPTELEHEMLYEAARSFAVAASDLKAASDAMNRVVTLHAGELMDDRESLEQLAENLQGSFERYEQAQAALFGVLIDEGTK
jgi:ABC-type transporter Mla subunit MlaD